MCGDAYVQLLCFFFLIYSSTLSFCIYSFSHSFLYLWIDTCTLSCSLSHLFIDWRSSLLSDLFIDWKSSCSLFHLPIDWLLYLLIHLFIFFCMYSLVFIGSSIYNAGSPDCYSSLPSGITWPRSSWHWTRALARAPRHEQKRCWQRPRGKCWGEFTRYCVCVCLCLCVCVCIHTHTCTYIHNI